MKRKRKKKEKKKKKKKKKEKKKKKKKKEIKEEPLLLLYISLLRNKAHRTHPHRRFMSSLRNFSFFITAFTTKNFSTQVAMIFPDAVRVGVKKKKKKKKKKG